MITSKEERKKALFKVANVSLPLNFVALLNPGRIKDMNFFESSLAIVKGPNENIILVKIIPNSKCPIDEIQIPESLKISIRSQEGEIIPVVPYDDVTYCTALQVEPQFETHGKNYSKQITDFLATDSHPVSIGSFFIINKRGKKLTFKVTNCLPKDRCIASRATKIYQINSIPPIRYAKALSQRFNEYFYENCTLEKIKKYVWFPLLHKTLVRAAKTPSQNGVLILGKNGTGKTALLSSIGNLMNVPSLYVDLQRLMLLPADEISEKLKKCFTFPVDKESSLLLFDDLNSIFEKAQFMPFKRIAALFMGLFDQILHTEGVVVIATANSLDDFPSKYANSVTRYGRFGFHIEINKLSQKQRENIIKYNIAGFNSLSDDDIQLIAKTVASEMTPSEIKKLCKTAIKNLTNEMELTKKTDSGIAEVLNGILTIEHFGCQRPKIESEPEPELENENEIENEEESIKEIIQYSENESTNSLGRKRSHKFSGSNSLKTEENDGELVHSEGKKDIIEKDNSDSQKNYESVAEITSNRKRRDPFAKNVEEPKIEKIGKIANHLEEKTKSSEYKIDDVENPFASEIVEDEIISKNEQINLNSNRSNEIENEKSSSNKKRRPFEDPFSEKTNSDTNDIKKIKRKDPGNKFDLNNPINSSKDEKISIKKIESKEKVTSNKRKLAFEENNRDNEEPTNQKISSKDGEKDSSSENRPKPRKSPFALAKDDSSSDDEAEKNNNKDYGKGRKSPFMSATSNDDSEDKEENNKSTRKSPFALCTEENVEKPKPKHNSPVSQTKLQNNITPIPKEKSNPFLADPQNDVIIPKRKQQITHNNFDQPIKKRRLFDPPPTESVVDTQFDHKQVNNELFPRSHSTEISSKTGNKMPTRKRPFDIEMGDSEEITSNKPEKVIKDPNFAQNPFNIVPQNQALPDSFENKNTSSQEFPSKKLNDDKFNVINNQIVSIINNPVENHSDACFGVNSPNHGNEDINPNDEEDIPLFNPFGSPETPTQIEPDNKINFENPLLNKNSDIVDLSTPQRTTANDIRSIFSSNLESSIDDINPNNIYDNQSSIVPEQQPSLICNETNNSSVFQSQPLENTFQPIQQDFVPNRNESSSSNLPQRKTNPFDSSKANNTMEPDSFSQQNMEKPSTRNTPVNRPKRKLAFEESEDNDNFQMQNKKQLPFGQPQQIVFPKKTIKNNLPTNPFSSTQTESSDKELKFAPNIPLNPLDKFSSSSIAERVSSDYGTFSGISPGAPIQQQPSPVVIKRSKFTEDDQIDQNKFPNQNEINKRVDPFQNSNLNNSTRNNNSTTYSNPIFTASANPQGVVIRKAKFEDINDNDDDFKYEASQNQFPNKFQLSNQPQQQIFDPIENNNQLSSGFNNDKRNKNPFVDSSKSENRLPKRKLAFEEENNQNMFHQKSSQNISSFENVALHTKSTSEDILSLNSSMNANLFGNEMPKDPFANKKLTFGSNGFGSDNKSNDGNALFDNNPFNNNQFTPQPRNGVFSTYDAPQNIPKQLNRGNPFSSNQMINSNLASNSHNSPFSINNNNSNYNNQNRGNPFSQNNSGTFPQRSGKQQQNQSNVDDLLDF
ncbi:hypothetical protein TRFO_04475 [Tritrichomonas foetus]|uniref:AAA+ ATPase domain-containing protein n=1 Tax=Tritrichomonas foetus TaxID=1144522 RepID=A0A1J4KJP6_9EUKA|nr:hypothetical protein TRFO_04475 [Tritrichomonas foetus]|eukprot:OHT09918.1 hypothetical protein TRFO_04475 [Tritrichomonas foetus]